MGKSSPWVRWLFRSKAITRGWPLASLSSCWGKSWVSTPLSHTATRTGLYLPLAGSVILRAAQMSAFSTLCWSR